MANNNGGVIGKNNGTSFAGAVEIQHTFTCGSGTFTTQPGTGLINSLIVAGGAGGGGSVGCGGANGGGGAGGLRSLESVLVSGGTTYGSVVGAGGSAGPTSAPGIGGDGVDSSLTIGSLTYTSDGGGYGGAPQPSPTSKPGGDGGSGGG